MLVKFEQNRVVRGLNYNYVSALSLSFKFEQAEHLAPTAKCSLRSQQNLANIWASQHFGVTNISTTSWTDQVPPALGTA